MFLLVLVHPGSPRQKAAKQLCGVRVCMETLSARHAGCKTLLQQTPPVLTRLPAVTPVTVYNCHKTIVWLCVIDRYMSQQSTGMFGIMSSQNSFSVHL